MLSVGSEFAGRFRVVRAIAAGGMGAVFEVDDAQTGRRRALKVMLPHIMASEAQRRRFDAEARVGARIRSEHVVEVFDTGVDAASAMPWMLMELLSGETLDAAVQRRGPMPRGEVARVFGELGHALGAAHRAGVLHLDLKPANILLWTPDRADGGRHVKVLDFGLARLIDAGRSAAALTTAAGTTAWMAPEQFEHGEQVRPAVDVWPLGLIAFYLLTGREYWSGCNVAEEAFNPRALQLEVLFAPLVPASQRAAELGVGPLLPAGFDAWFARCAVREAERRWRDADEAVRSLLPVLNPPVALAPTAFDLSKPQVAATQLVSAPPPSTPPPTLAGAPSHPAFAYPQGPTDSAWASRAPTHAPGRGSGAWVVVGGVAALALAAGGSALWLSRAPSAPSEPPPPLVTPSASVRAAATQPATAPPPQEAPMAPSPSQVPPAWGTGPMPDVVTVSSHMRERREFHPSVDAFDGSLDTAWNDGVEGDPRGQWIEAEFAEPRRIKGFRITTGWLHTTRRGEDLYAANTRVRALRLSADGRELGRWEAPDGTRELFVSNLDARARRFRFEVTDVWWGARYQDLAISEIAFVAPQGEPAAPWFVGWRGPAQERYRGEARCLRHALRDASDLRLRTDLTLLSADVGMACNRGNTAGED